ncbi:MAG: tRNA glutamyl-Q(34) synthetase GluQRS [Thalassotalea sp.]|nr:tRNA glutamyl-Q(34) synthetase GluQRS [Thalassotalea sp.]
MALPLTERPNIQYRGRFAPSPSGLLHFGSLVTALASYLDAKANNGVWLVRIEDIDPPREQQGASKAILDALEAYHLFWDETVLYQSQQSKLYEQVLDYFAQHQQSYYCQCTRAMIKVQGGIYQGHCKQLNNEKAGSGTRLINQYPAIDYQDLIQGKVVCDPALAKEDFIIKRKDGLYAYQLAVVVDDIFQGITNIVRGCDLLEPTARQLTLYQTFGYTPPQYAHVPLIVTEEGYKLSKQNKAPAIDVNSPQKSLIAALHVLGQKPPKELHDLSCQALIDWAIKHWSLDKVPKVAELVWRE